ncbi:MAG: permease [Chloroflexaceae bacterium]|nr:permease [Chloroflexaceae bacterium]NJO06255.1 permease [Chloroflexaceae bacterium]
MGGLWLASDISVPPALAPWSGRLQGFVTVFLGIFIEALPFLLAGVLLSAIIALFVTEEQIRRLSPRNPLLAAVGGALLGLAFPVCECGSIPAARRLISKGVALPAGIAFVLAAPVVNPIVIVSTYVAFSSWTVVAWRVGLTILFAVIIGMLVGIVRDASHVVAAGVGPCNDDPDHHHHHDPNHHHDHQHDHYHIEDVQAGLLRRVLNHATIEFFEMSRFLIAGALLAATLQTFIPQQALMALGGGAVLSVLVMMGLAVLLSVCSTVDSFIALSFVNTFTPGAVLAFLVFGPMIDIKSTLMLTTTFQRHIVALIVVLCFLLSFLAGIVINYFFAWGVFS